MEGLFESSNGENWIVQNTSNA